MKIGVVGATGNVGSAFVTQALEKGHEVIALSRSGGGHSQARCMSVDVLDTAKLTALLRDSDAIFSAIGGTLNTREQGIASIIQAAETAGIDRVVSIGGAGILGLPDGTLVCESPHFPDFLQSVCQAHLAAFRHLEKSRLQWTFICPGAMVDGPPTANFRHQSELALPDGNQVRFSDVAQLALECIEDQFYLRQKVAIAN